MKKINGQKYLLCYTYRQNEQVKKGWHTLTLTSGSNYKKATAVLKQQAPRRQISAGRDIIEVIAMYTNNSNVTTFL